MADKQSQKLKMKRKRSKVNSKVRNDLSLEDVVAAGGDEVRALCPFRQMVCVSERIIPMLALCMR